MLAVDVGVGHQHDLVIPQLGDIELVVYPGAQRGDDRLHLGVLQHPVDAGLLDVDDLAAQRQDRLEHRVTTALGRAASRITLHHIEFRLARIGRPTVGQLAGQPPDIGSALAPHQLSRLARRDPGLRRRNRLVDHDFRVGGVRLEPMGELLVAHPLHERLDLGVAELGLRLAFELRFGDLRPK